MDDAVREAADCGDRLWAAYTRLVRALLGAQSGAVERWLPELIDVAGQLDDLLFGADAADYQPPSHWPERTIASESELAAGRRLWAAGLNRPIGSQWEPVVTLLAGRGTLREALRISESRISFRESLPDPAVTEFDGKVYHGAAIAFRQLGQPDQARHALEAELAIHRRSHNPVEEMFTLAVAIFVEIDYAADKPAERRRLALERMDARQRAIGAYDTGLGDPTISSLRLLEGQWSGIGPAITDVDLTRGRMLVFGPGNQIAGRQAQLAAYQGRVADAWTAILTILPDGPATEPGNVVLMFALMVQRVATELSLDAGDLNAAKAWLEAHDRWLAWSEAVLGRAESHLLWSCYHRLSGDTVAALEHARQSLAEANEPRRPVALLTAQRHLGQLATEAGEFDEARKYLSDSLALATACEAPFERALTLVALAELDMASSNLDAARERLDEARAICEPLEARPTLERIARLVVRIGGVA
jgi:tetratricopeptide (TPR) repeat protein